MFRSGGGGTGERKEKERVVEDIRNKSSQSVEELGMTEESSSVTGDRGGGLGVGGLHPERGREMGMAIDNEGGAEDD